MSTARRGRRLQDNLDGGQQLAGGLHNGVMELYVQAGLTLQHQCLQEQDMNMFYIGIRMYTLYKTN